MTPLCRSWQVKWGGPFMASLPGWHHAKVVEPVATPIDERKHPTEDPNDPWYGYGHAVLCSMSIFFVPTVKARAAVLCTILFLLHEPFLLSSPTPLPPHSPIPISTIATITVFTGLYFSVFLF